MDDKNKVSARYVIINPLLDLPMKATPSGMSLENVTFATKKELTEFVEKHWDSPVFMTDGKDLELPD